MQKGKGSVHRHKINYGSGSLSKANVEMPRLSKPDDGILRNLSSYISMPALVSAFWISREAINTCSTLLYSLRATKSS